MNIAEDHRGRNHMVIGFTLPVQSMHIINKVMSSNPAHGDVHTIQNYVVKFVSYGGFLWILWFPPPIKLTAMI